jgi:Flp pilus assembly protein TadD
MRASRRSGVGRGAARAPRKARSTSPPAPRSDRRSWLVLLAALFVVAFITYGPSLHGLPLWDDDAHLTPPSLRTPDGLRQIWTDVGATQQYYPLVHSAFWVMYHLWGEDTTGYHVVNVGLHALSAFLLAVLLSRLNVTGAWFAAFLFAVHPVQVESVAWMTELKNTLSTPLYLGAALAYLSFDTSRRRSHYLLAIGLFVLALFSKTVVATLPVSLAIVAWWRRGEIRWATDVRPLVPFFVLAIAAGAMTSWVEHALIGAKGADFELTALERGLLAGRAVWFYLSKLVWPAHLVFTYPRWIVDQAVSWQYLYPLALAGAMVMLWRWRHASRAPLAALLLYCVALGPALGFVNVYPFRFSYVADHFQYTATVAAMAFMGAALTKVASRVIRRAAIRTTLAATTIALLGFLSWHESHQYANAETLLRSTISRNPDAWMAHHNLAIILMNAREANYDEALRHVEISLRLQRNNPEAFNTRGSLRLLSGDVPAARRDFEESIRLNPMLASPHTNLGAVKHQEGRLEEAMTEYREAIRLDPRDAEAHRNLGIALAELGRLVEADAAFQRAYELNPANADIVYNLATFRLRQDRIDEAVRLFRRALELRPAFPAARDSLETALRRQGRGK